MAQRRRDPAPALTDKDLVLEFQSGSRAAYDEMFRRYRGRVYRICVRMLGNRQDAEEATQETFLKAYVALTRFNGNFQLGAWLSRIATNVCLDHLRSRGRSTLVALPQTDHDALGAEAGPEESYVPQNDRLEQAISEIRPLHAQVLAMRAVEGLSHQEIAGQMSMSSSQVKALLHRARASLRRAFENAQGFVLAPILGIKSFLGDRSESASQASTNLAAVTPSMPFIADKMATSAMIVAVALTGLPSAPHLGPGSASGLPTRPAPVERDALDHSTPVKAETLDAPVAAEARSDEAVARSESLAVTVDPETLTDTLQAEVEHRTKGDDDDRKENDDEDGPIDDANAATVDEALRDVKEGAEDLTDPDLGEITPR